MADPVVMFDDGCEFLEKHKPISVVEENVPFAITASGDCDRAHLGRQYVVVVTYDIVKTVD